MNSSSSSFTRPFDAFASNYDGLWSNKRICPHACLSVIGFPQGNSQLGVAWDSLTRQWPLMDHVEGCHLFLLCIECDYDYSIKAIRSSFLTIVSQQLDLLDEWVFWFINLRMVEIDKFKMSVVTLSPPTHAHHAHTSSSSHALKSPSILWSKGKNVS